jgi:hypothetical protein
MESLHLLQIPISVKPSLLGFWQDGHRVEKTSEVQAEAKVGKFTQ